MLFNKGQPVYLAHSVIVSIVSVFPFPCVSLDGTLDEVLTIVFFDPFHFLGEAQQEFLVKHLLVHNVV